MSEIKDEQTRDSSSAEIVTSIEKMLEFTLSFCPEVIEGMYEKYRVLAEEYHKYETKYAELLNESDEIVNNQERENFITKYVVEPMKRSNAARKKMEGLEISSCKTSLTTYFHFTQYVLYGYLGDKDGKILKMGKLQNMNIRCYKEGKPAERAYIIPPGFPISIMEGGVAYDPDDRYRLLIYKDRFEAIFADNKPYPIYSDEDNLFGGISEIPLDKLPNNNA